MNKILNIRIRGELYKCNDIQQFVRTDMPMKFHDSWKFLGGMTHHWCNHINVRFKDAWENPKLLIGCMLVDLDHETMRVWGGSYNGKLPRITQAYFTEE